MKKQLRSKIENLKTYLNTSKTVKSSEVIEVYKEFCEELNRPKYRKKDTGCMSCLVAMIKEMSSYIEKNPSRKGGKTKKEEKPNSLDNTNDAKKDAKKDNDDVAQQDDVNNDENKKGSE